MMKRLLLSDIMLKMNGKATCRDTGRTANAVKDIISANIFPTADLLRSNRHTIHAESVYSHVQSADLL